MDDLMSEEEIAQCQAAYHDYVTTADDQFECLVATARAAHALAREVERLREALSTYGAHNARCARTYRTNAQLVRNEWSACTCGFAEVQREEGTCDRST